MWPFGKSADQKANEAIARVEKRIDGLIKSEQEARESAAKYRAELAVVNARNAEIQSQLRKQTEADLYFVSAKIMRDIMETGKHAPTDRDRQAAWLAGYQQAQQSNPGLGQLGGGAAPYSQSLFGSIFGGR